MNKRKQDGHGVRINMPVEKESELFSKRSKIEIMANILEKTRERSKKTHIMNHCNLSFRQLQRYLKSLRIKGLVQKEDSGRVILYKITKKGRRFLRRYSRIAFLLGRGH